MFLQFLIDHWTAILALIAGGVLFYQSAVNVGGQEIAQLERRWLGAKMPQGRVVALGNEVGIQARTFGPGLHFLIPFLYVAKKLPQTVIAEDEIGIVQSIDGNAIPTGRIFAGEVEGHNNFQDGEAFLKNGGQKGPQIAIIPPGNWRINSYLFKVTIQKVFSVAEDEVGLVESIDGAPIPAGRIYAKLVEGHNNFQDGQAFIDNGGEKGPQIEMIPPGDYRIHPGLFKTTPVKQVVVQRGEVGVVVAQDGAPIPMGRLLAQSAGGHNNFQDGQAFINNGGQKGPQIDVLLPGTYRINLGLFKVQIAPAVVIDANRVGLVTALDGVPLPEREYVASPVVGHEDYQNGSAFLAQNGQRGPQFDVLRPGTYYINPLMFKVEMDEVAVVERGQVAVIVSNVGDDPTEEMKKRLGSSQTNASEEEGKEKYVVPKGFRGIQEEVAGPGRYYLNRRAFMAYTIDTTNITIDWDEQEETRFDQLTVISKDGFPIQVAVKVVIRVRPDQAPYMVAKVGSIDNLIQHVIHPMIDSSFRNQASTASAMNFLQSRSEEQAKAEQRARVDLEKYHVECVSVLICQIRLPEELMQTQTARIIAEQQQEMYAMEQKAQLQRTEMEKTKATADQQPTLVKAVIAVQVAEQKKTETITLAEADAEKLRLEGKGEGDKLRAIGDGEAAKIAATGTATAEAYEKQKAAIGEAAIKDIKIVELIAAAIENGQIKIVPDVLVTGGGGASDGLMGALTRLAPGAAGLLGVKAVEKVAEK